MKASDIKTGMRIALSYGDYPKVTKVERVVGNIVKVTFEDGRTKRYSPNDNRVQEAIVY